MSPTPARGFTLIEVSVALVILAISLTVLLEVQVSSLANASRSRGLTIGSLLARSKMIDIEQTLFDEGFTLGEDSDEGDFDEEGHEDFKWSYTVTEIEFDLGGLGGMCGGFGEEGGDGGDCESMLGGFGGALDNFTRELGRSMRLVLLTVTWPEGKYEEKLEVHAIVTREDYSMAPVTDSLFTEIK